MGLTHITTVTEAVFNCRLRNIWDELSNFFFCVRDIKYRSLSSHEIPSRSLNIWKIENLQVPKMLNFNTYVVRTLIHVKVHLDSCILEIEFICFQICINNRFFKSDTVHFSNNCAWCMLSRTLVSVWSARCPVRPNELLCCRVRSNRYEVSTVVYAWHFYSRSNIARFPYLSAFRLRLIHKPSIGVQFS